MRTLILCILSWKIENFRNAWIPVHELSIVPYNVSWETEIFLIITFASVVEPWLRRKNPFETITTHNLQLFRNNSHKTYNLVFLPLLLYAEEELVENVSAVRTRGRRVFKIYTAGPRLPLSTYSFTRLPILLSLR